jgi:hypothetical protein
MIATKPVDRYAHSSRVRPLPRTTACFQPMQLREVVVVARDVIWRHHPNVASTRTRAIRIVVGGTSRTASAGRRLRERCRLAGRTCGAGRPRLSESSSSRKVVVHGENVCTNRADAAAARVRRHNLPRR